MAHTVSARTVSIPTHAISTTDFNLTQENAQSLYGWGKDAASAFFNDPAQKSYLNSFGRALGAPPAPAASPAVPLAQPAATTSP